MKKTLLVTGGCGYIGSHVTRQLTEAGRDVVVLDNLSTGSREALLHGEKLIVGDSGDPALLKEIFSSHDIGAVLHFAGSIVVPESVAAPLPYYRNNTAASLALIGAAVEAKVDGFIFSSTASVYGENLDLLSEATPTSPTNPYSRSKLMTEWVLQDVAHASSLRYGILRYFNVAGADPGGRIGQRSPNATHLIKVASQVATGTRGSVTVFGEDYPTPDGTGVRDYIHVEDLASAHLAALAYLEGGGDSVLLNCGYGRGYSVREVLNEMKNVAGEFAVAYGPRRPGDVASLVADTTKIRRTLDWHPAHDSLKEICASALEWERKQKRS